MVCKSPINIFRKKSIEIPMMNMNEIYSCKDKKYYENEIIQLKNNMEWKREYLKLRWQKRQIEENQYRKLSKIQRQQYYLSHQRPCGECLGCLLDNAKQWGIRATAEAKFWEHKYFLTFTYNNKNVPIIPEKDGYILNLNNEEFKNFIHRKLAGNGVKRWINPMTGKKEKPIRYLACSEYGPNTHRPHYHMVLFNYEIDDLKIRKKKTNYYLYTSEKMNKLWGKGRVIITEANDKTASYVARYTQKKAYENAIKFDKKKKEKDWLFEPIEENIKYNLNVERKNTRKDPRQRERTFTSTRPGLGYIYWDINKNEVKQNNGFYNDEQKLLTLPRYFKKLWEKENWEEYTKNEYKRQMEREYKNEILSKNSGLHIDAINKKRYESLQDKWKKLRRDSDDMEEVTHSSLDS